MDTSVYGRQVNWRPYANPQLNDRVSQVIDLIYDAAAQSNKQKSCNAILECILNHFEDLVQIETPDSPVMPDNLQEAMVVYILRTKDDNLPLSQDHIHDAITRLKGLLTEEQSAIITHYQQHNPLLPLAELNLQMFWYLARPDVVHFHTTCTTV